MRSGMRPLVQGFVRRPRAAEMSLLHLFAPPPPAARETECHFTALRFQHAYHRTETLACCCNSAASDRNQQHVAFFRTRSFVPCFIVLLIVVMLSLLCLRNAT
eukprot:TRINITY_DN12263_c0_g1_i1.p1 TRINITY_DN12263_c0_g1~~TRINITY_DN12263_c0_g1_i1.p1  ORF type:complete len:103 (+),score=11.17 TRINITY_DN12263_c0_g1_i1:68-376(+)